MMVEGECVVAAVDSWAGRCFVDEEVAVQMCQPNGPHIEPNRKNWTVKLGAKNGDSCTLQIAGTIVLECRIGSHGEIFNQEFLVLKDKAGPAFTLGLDWMANTDAMVGKDRIEFNDSGNRISLPFVSEQGADEWIDSTVIHQMAILNDQERWHLFGRMCVVRPSPLEKEEVETKKPSTVESYRDTNSLRLHSSVIGFDSQDFGTTPTPYLSWEQERGQSSKSSTRHNKRQNATTSSVPCSIL